MKVESDNRLGFVCAVEQMIDKSFVEPPPVDIVSWAEGAFRLSSVDSSMPGLFSTRSAPFQADILRLMAGRKYRTVTLRIGSQCGKTLTLLVYLAYQIECQPSSLIAMYLPTDDLALSVSQDRVQPMIESNDFLRKKLPKNKRDGGDRADKKTFTSGHSLAMLSASNAKHVTSTPRKIIIADELSKANTNVMGLGNPISLMKQRQITFPNAKLVLSSTPTLKGECLISEEYERSSQGEWYHECQLCFDFFVPKTAHVVCLENDDPRTARITCPTCGGMMTENEHKKGMRKGRLIHKFPDAESAGVWISSLSSPFVTLEQYVRLHQEAKTSPEKLIQFTNEQEAIEYEQTGTDITDKQLYELAETWGEDSLPNDVLYLTSGWDSQKTGFVGYVVGHGTEGRTYLIKRLECLGSILSTETQDQLVSHLRAPYYREDGARVGILRSFVDSGGATDDEGGFSQHIIKMCEKHRRHQLFAIKGSSMPDREIFQKTKKITGRQMPFMVGVTKGKDLIGNLLKQKDGDNATNCLKFSKHITEMDFQELTSEKRIYNKEKRKVEYKKIGGRRSEALDCVNYALAASFSLPYRTDKNQRWRLERALSEQKLQKQAKRAEKEEETPQNLVKDTIKVNKYAKMVR